MNCRKCQSTDFVKNGHINEKQRYKFKTCDYQWTETINIGADPRQNAHSPSFSTVMGSL